jgi:hypothetical protein
MFSARPTSSTTPPARPSVSRRSPRRTGIPAHARRRAHSGRAGGAARARRLRAARAAPPRHARPGLDRRRDLRRRPAPAGREQLLFDGPTARRGRGRRRRSGLPALPRRPGVPIASPLDDLVTGVTLEQLRAAKRRWIVAGVPVKYPGHQRRPARRVDRHARDGHRHGPVAAGGAALTAGAAPTSGTAVARVVAPRAGRRTAWRVITACPAGAMVPLGV